MCSIILFMTDAGIVNRSTPVGNTTMTGAARVNNYTGGAVGVTPTPKKICNKNDFQKFLIEIEDQEYEDEEEDTVLEEFKAISVSASDSQRMYGATMYEIVLPYECFAWSGPVPGTGEWRDRVSVNVWLLSIADVTTVKATVSDCYQKLLVWIKLPKIFDYHKLEERNSRMYYYKKSNEPIYPPTTYGVLLKKKPL
jgi:hypothetical protein